MTQCCRTNCKDGDEFYDYNRWICKGCIRKEARERRKTQRGQDSHRKYRESKKGLEKHIKHMNKYRGKGLHKKDHAKWKMKNRVTKDTLRQTLFPECEDCNENMDGGGSSSCSVANGAEDIKLCLVHLEWVRSGIHPLSGYQGNMECPYEPE